MPQFPSVLTLTLRLRHFVPFSFLLGGGRGLSSGISISRQMPVVTGGSCKKRGGRQNRPCWEPLTRTTDHPNQSFQTGPQHRLRRSLARKPDSRKPRGRGLRPRSCSHQVPPGDFWSGDGLGNRLLPLCLQGSASLLTPHHSGPLPRRPSPSYSQVLVPGQVGGCHRSAPSVPLLRSCPFNCGWTRSRGSCPPAGALAAPPRTGGDPLDPARGNSPWVARRADPPSSVRLPPSYRCGN